MHALVKAAHKLTAESLGILPESTQRNSTYSATSEQSHNGNFDLKPAYLSTPTDKQNEIQGITQYLGPASDPSLSETCQTPGKTRENQTLKPGPNEPVTAKTLIRFASNITLSVDTRYYDEELVKLEKKIDRLNTFQIITGLVGEIAKTVELIAPAGAVIKMISDFMGHIKSVVYMKLEALGLVRSAVETTISIQECLISIKFSLPARMLITIRNFYVRYFIETNTRIWVKDMERRLDDARFQFIQCGIMINVTGVYEIKAMFTDYMGQYRQRDESALRRVLVGTQQLSNTDLSDFLGLDNLSVGEMRTLQEVLRNHLKADRSASHSSLIPMKDDSSSNSQVGLSEASGSSQPIHQIFMVLGIIHDGPSLNKASSNTSNIEEAPDRVKDFLAHMGGERRTISTFLKPDDSIEDINHLRMRLFQRVSSILSDKIAHSPEHYEGPYITYGDPKNPNDPQRHLWKMYSKYMVREDESTQQASVQIDDLGLVKERLLSDGNKPVGKVWKGTWKGKTVRIKSIKQFPLPQLVELCSVQIENSPKVDYMDQIKKWRDAPSPYLINFVGTVNRDSASYWCLVSDYMPHGDVMHYLDSDRAIEADRVALVHQVAQGLLHLHVHRIIHGNLRPANVLINDKGEAVLADFGYQEGEEESSAPKDSRPFKSPELFASAEGEIKGVVLGPTELSDVFAFGKTAFQILTGDVPFHAHSWPWQTRYDRLWAQLSTVTVYELLGRCYAENPLHRLSMKQINEIMLKIGLTTHKDIPGLVLYSMRIRLKWWETNKMLQEHTNHPTLPRHLQNDLVAQINALNCRFLDDEVSYVEPSYIGHVLFNSAPKVIALKLSSYQINQCTAYYLIKDTSSLFK
ncbi:uncharacterized protein IL334_007778 [Kwoniella shivajii]|uniref:Protein kinase domain-containing protein n=1 Tax=Kwoniella shivajii TaxID=564305 RepID=A0ABZ1D9M2_9TREE|nr:hypothetical protein IL334_007778 [Kwoniella shivajii]